MTPLERARPADYPRAKSTPAANTGATAAALPAPRVSLTWSALLQRLDQRPVHFTLIAILATVLAALIAARFPDTDYVNEFFLDRYFQTRGAIPPQIVATELPHTNKIVMVEADSSIPRPMQAALLDRLRLAKVVAFDYMFVNQEAQLDEDELSSPWYRDARHEWKKDDQLLAKAFKANGKVVLGVWPEEERVSLAGTAKYTLRRIWEKPPPLLWNAARHHAHLEVDPGRDGVARHVKLFENTAKSGPPEPTPCMGLAIAAAAMNISPRDLKAAFIRNGVLHLGARRIRVGVENRMAIDFVGGRDSFEYDTNRIAYKYVFEYEPEDFRDAIIIVGERSIKSKEIFETPFGPMPGMQIHANIAATLMSPRGAPTLLPAWQTLLISLVCCLLFIAPLLRWPLWTGLPVVAALGGLLMMGGSALFVHGHQIFPAATALLALVLTYNTVALYEYRRARETLGRFIGQEMVAPTLNVFSRLQVGGRIEEATAMFCDLRGYSALSERYAVETTSRLINDYTSTLVKTVKRFGGRPIDYQGDGVFVLFERSTAGAEYSWRAVQAALALENDFQILLKTWNDEDAEVFGSALDVGIGIETGEMMIGLVGAAEHLKPGAIGDAVNVASRVQRLNYECGFSILLTQTTYDRVREKLQQENCAATPCGSFPIKGREAPVEIFGIGEPITNPISQQDSVA